MIIGTNFKLSSKKYLDNRQQCTSLNDLIINKDSILYPQGFEVYCIKEKAWYQNVSEGDTPEWKIRQSGTSEGGASIDDTKISATTTWSSEYIYDMKLELQDLITQTEDYVAEIDNRLLYVEGRLISIGSFDGSYDSLTNKPEFPSLQGYATHEYVDEIIANIGKIEGTKDYNELINQPINNVVIEYMIDERLIANVDYLEVGKWYIVNTDLNEEYNSATSFSLIYYLSSDSYSIINTFENEDMHSLIYVSSKDEKEINIIYISPSGGTYELIYNIESYSTVINPLSLSTNNTLTYTPTEDYHPATKKYVDDIVTSGNINVDLDDYVTKTELDSVNYNIGENIVRLFEEKIIMSQYIKDSNFKRGEVGEAVNRYINFNTNLSNIVVGDFYEIWFDDNSTPMGNKLLFYYSVNNTYFISRVLSITINNESVQVLFRLIKDKTTDENGNLVEAVGKCCLQLTLAKTNSTEENIALLDEIMIVLRFLKPRFLPTNNTNEYTPTEDYHPATKKYVDDLVSNVDIDLSDYITNTELEEKGYITEIPSEYITETELEEKGYITEIPSEYITNTELEEKGYITEIPTEYITETELTNKGYLTEIPTEYITETELTNKGYVTDTELEEEMIFETDILTVNALGGISANTDLNGLTVKEILNKLLFPYIAPVITVTATPNGGTYEKGNTQTITNVKVVVTKKSEKITKIEILNGTQVIARQNDEAIVDGGTFNYTVSVSVPSTNKQLTVKVTDNSGTETTKTTNSFTFVYPYYWGVCEETDVINADLVKGLTKSVTSKGTKTVTYTTNNQKMIFAYPKSYGTITKILDPNSFDVTSTFTMSQITIIGLDGTGQSYYVYVNSPSTVSDFNMKFSY